MHRRNFLGLAAAAAPMIFVPKLITANWGIVKPSVVRIPFWDHYTPEFQEYLKDLYLKEWR